MGKDQSGLEDFGTFGFVEDHLTDVASWDMYFSHDLSKAILAALLRGTLLWLGDVQMR